MQSNNIVDVLIPVYNCDKYIKKCLNSLLSQTYKDLNIIIADDGSTDGTNKILIHYQNHYKNISIFTKSNENNISKTRNFLLSKIQNEYFTFFDADDYAEPEYIEELIKNLKAYSCEISMCKKIRHHEKYSKKIKNKSCNLLYFLNKTEALAEMLSSNLYNGTVYCKLFKTNLLKNIKFNEKIHYGEDLDFCFKIMQNANKFILSNKKLYHYVIRKNSIVTSKFNKNKLTCLDCYDNIINQLSSNIQLMVCAKSMKGLIATELLYYIWRDKYHDKKLKYTIKNIIKSSLPYIKQNKHLPIILKLSPCVLWLTKFM